MRLTGRGYLVLISAYIILWFVIVANLPYEFMRL